MNQDLVSLSNAETALNLFDLWIETTKQIKEFPDCRRFDADFIRNYGIDYNSPLHLMFLSFIGAVDLIDYIGERRR